MSKRFRMFAEPNGSGKSSLIAQITKDFNMGYFINADIVEAELKNQRFLDCDNYISKTLSQADWDTFVRSYDMLSRVGNDDFPKIIITDNVLVAEGAINSYHDVPSEKIVGRYYRSLELLASAFKLADRAFVLDNSNESRDVVVEKDGRHIFVHSAVVPTWIERYLFKRLNLK